MRNLLIGGFAFFLVQSVYASGLDYQKMADGARWAWDDYDATVLRSIERDNSDYDIRLSKTVEDRDHLVVTILKGQKAVYSWKGHRHSVFRIMDDVLYYPEFHFSSSGCTVVAHDLKKQKEVWRVPVVGLGGVSHSAYLNTIAIDVGGDVVSIHGHESYGDYLQYKDRKNGKTVGQKIFRKGW